MYRFAAAGVMTTGLFILPLAVSPPVDIVYLSVARALETGAFACLYVWTPEVSMGTSIPTECQLLVQAWIAWQVSGN